MLKRPSGCSGSGKHEPGVGRGKMDRKDDDIFLFRVGDSSFARLIWGISSAVGLTTSTDGLGILDVLILSMLERVTDRGQRIEGDFLRVGVLTKGSSRSIAGEALDEA